MKDRPGRTLGRFLDPDAALRGTAKAVVAEKARFTHAGGREQARDAARSLQALGVRRGDDVRRADRQ